MNNLTLGSLFSGIGGFELAAQREGIETLWSCEIEKFQRQILTQHFSNTQIYEDINYLPNLRQPSIICGGFPCQDISLSGSGVGISGERSGLWKKMLGLCRDLRPQYIVIENSPMLVSRGLETVLNDIAQIGGYVAEWQSISNATFGYPHKRERLYLIAHTYKEYEQTNFFEQGNFREVFSGWSSEVAHSFSCAKEFYNLSTNYPVRNTDGFRDWTHRAQSIGNAVNVTVAQYLFKCIKAHHICMTQL